MNEEHTTLEEAEQAIFVLLPIWRTLTPMSRAQFATALRAMAEHIDPPFLRTPRLPEYKLERLRDLHMRRDG